MNIHLGTEGGSTIQVYNNYSLENQMDPTNNTLLSMPKMGSKKKSFEPEGFGFLVKILYGIPAASFPLILVFLWSSSSIMISTRKLNCHSQAQPKFAIVGRRDSPQETLSVNSSDDVLGTPNSFSHKTSFAKKRDEGYKNAVKSIEEQVQVLRTWKSDHPKNPSSCAGRGIYVYEMPPKFNKDLLSQCGEMTPWVDFCKYFANDALGEQIKKLGKCWYNTHQYTLELIFHSRVLKHPCRVHNQNEAMLFYVPFYGGLDMMRWQFKINVSSEMKDSLGIEMVQWLKMQKPWKKNSGKDHVLVLSNVSWDYRRLKGSTWGTILLELEEMQNPIKILSERQLWKLNDIGVPYPTHFHPHSDNDIILWQQKIISSKRKSLVSFAGAARPNDPKNIRSVLINQCTNSTAQEQCRFLNCKSFRCEKPQSVMKLFMESEFCLQPPGDSPTRKSVFDSLVSGCIPVIFDPFTAYYQYSWHLPEDHEKYSVFIDQEEVREMKVNVVERLTKVALKEREELRRYIVYELMPGLVYGDKDAHFDKFQDAFAITINNLIDRETKSD